MWNCCERELVCTIMTIPRTVQQVLCTPVINISRDRAAESRYYSNLSAKSTGSSPISVCVPKLMCSQQVGAAVLNEENVKIVSSELRVLSPCDMALFRLEWRLLKPPE
mmetsp:Transcript_16747/g.48181  ORF Transcript_16747/g.48181 Transcript_16747/m.48181 type:complete len:108 (-) Transcript_16747:750-1073(-)